MIVGHRRVVDVVVFVAAQTGKLLFAPCPFGRIDGFEASSADAAASVRIVSGVSSKMNASKTPFHRRLRRAAHDDGIRTDVAVEATPPTSGSAPTRRR